MFKQLALFTLLSPCLTGAIDFVRDVKPILEFNCVSCHQASKPLGNLRLDKYAQMLKGAGGKPVLIAGKPLESLIYTTTVLAADDEKVMPPTKDMQVLSKPETEILKNWIKEGAQWPKEITLKAKKRPSKEIVAAGITPTELYRKLGFEKLAGKIQHGKGYSNTIADTEVKYEMVAIPGGKYTRGGSEAGEGPKREINIDPFWMQKYEVSWDQYEIWQFNIDIKNRDKATYQANANDAVADIVSRPTGPYLDMSFGMGKKNRPAVCMTQLAAKSYCMWLSAKTGHFYRLATEAEWEYACRAGTTTKYHFGDDASKIEEYGWFYDNTDGDGYKERGTKKPNAWGLYDMHGNVAEWVLDSFDPEFYKNGTTDNPICLPPKGGKLNPGVEAPWPNKLYGRVARGGSWDDDVEDLRSASRKLSEPEWKIRDPQLPKSVWYHTDATAVGFRIVRAARIPALKDISKYWPSEEEIIAIPPR